MDGFDTTFGLSTPAGLNLIAGQTHDARFADFGAKVEMYAEVALALTQQARL